MAHNPLFTNSSNSPTRTTRPTKAVNEAPTHVKLTHNTFDNSYFNFKTQRYGMYEPFFWKHCVPGDNEPFSNSHNVRSLPFASPILSPMKLNKDYFQVPMYAIQPNAWDHIYKNPTQGDDVPADAQNLFPLFSDSSVSADPLSIFGTFASAFSGLVTATSSDGALFSRSLLIFMMYENFFSSGSLLYQMGYKINPLFKTSANELISYDEAFDIIFSDIILFATFIFDDPDSASGSRSVSFKTADIGRTATIVDRFTFVSLCRNFFGNIVGFEILNPSILTGSNFGLSANFDLFNLTTSTGNIGVDSIRMDTILAYQLACAQYYVNPRVDFIYNAQLYRDNFVQLVRDVVYNDGGDPLALNTFDYNGIPVLYDYFSTVYYREISNRLASPEPFWVDTLPDIIDMGAVLYYLFGFREQLLFGDYLVDSRTQSLGYGEPGSDVVQVMDSAVSVTDLSQKLVLQRFRGAVAHLDNSAEDYLETMFHETLPPDYHYPKFIAHSEFGVNGEEISNTTSDDQGNIVTNLKSGSDTAEFNIAISVPSILVGISYISIPGVRSQIKERHYMHADRYDMFQPMLQYFGDQGICNREVSDTIPNPDESYGYTSRNGEYKQRMSQCSGGFLTSLRSWLFTLDLPAFAGESSQLRFSDTQSPLAIRTYDWEFNRFLKQQTGISLGTGFHFIMQYNNKNVDNRPMDVNPLPLYPNSTL